MHKTKPSVAEALHRALAAVLKDLQNLEQASASTRNEGLAELCCLLEATRKHITKHFRFEEEDGYMDVIREREPRLERTIQELAEEHGQLAQSLDLLIWEAQKSTSLGDELRREVHDWVDRIRRHEVRENNLVQDAFNQDVTAED
jgi:hemerythrin